MKVGVDVDCSINTFAPSKSSDTFTFYFHSDPSTAADTVKIPEWVQSNTDTVPTSYCGYSETLSMTGAASDTDLLVIN